MAIKAPDWASPAEVDDHGALFLSLFAGRDHFDNFLQTGEMALPKTLHDNARRKADPVQVQRNRLRKPVDYYGRAIARTELAVIEAEAYLADALNTPWRAQAAEKVQTLTRTLMEQRVKLAAAETTLALFDEMRHAEVT